jgi:hypothetical protein
MASAQSLRIDLRMKEKRLFQEVDQLEPHVPLALRMRSLVVGAAHVDKHTRGSQRMLAGINAWKRTM